MEYLDTILQEIFNIKRNTQFCFDDYFMKYSIPENDRFPLYRQLMVLLCGYVQLENGYETNGFVEVISKYKNSMVGLPYTLPHLKIK